MIEGLIAIAALSGIGLLGAAIVILLVKWARK